MFGLGGPEVFWIAIIVLILFGGQKLPEIMRSVGRGIREFKRESSKLMDDLTGALDDDENRRA